MTTDPAAFIFSRQTFWAARHGHSLIGSAGMFTIKRTMERGV